MIRLLHAAELSEAEPRSDGRRVGYVFFRNFVHLAVGQLWILAKAIGRA